MGNSIVFLRGINVGGQRKIKMAALRKSLEDGGFDSVVTYIQSGNLVIGNTSLGNDELAQKVQELMVKDFGFEIPVLVMTVDELEQIVSRNPFLETAEEKNLYFALLYEIPDEDAMANLDPLDYPNEAFFVTDQCIYLNCRMGAGKAKLSNNVIEAKLKVTATTRNLKTMEKMVGLAL